MGCENRTKMIALLVFLVTFVGPTTGLTTCSADPVYVNETATITCDFGQDLDPSATTLTIAHVVNNTHVCVVDCFPGPGNTSLCNTNENYVLQNNRTVTNPFVVDIPGVTPDFAGTYECHLVPSNPKDVEPCVLQVNERSVDTTTQPTSVPILTTQGTIESTTEVPADSEKVNDGTIESTTEVPADSEKVNDEDTTKDTIVAASVPVVVAVVAAFLFLFLFCWLRRRKKMIAKRKSASECETGANPQEMTETGQESSQYRQGQVLGQQQQPDEQDHLLPSQLDERNSDEREGNGHSGQEGTVICDSPFGSQCSVKFTSSGKSDGGDELSMESESGAGSDNGEMGDEDEFISNAGVANITLDMCRISDSLGKSVK